MNRVLQVVSTLCCVLGLAACGGGDEDKTTATGPATDAGQPVETEEDGGVPAVSCTQSTDCAHDVSQVCRPLFGTERACVEVACRNNGNCAPSERCLPKSQLCSWAQCLTDDDCGSDHACDEMTRQCGPRCAPTEEVCNNTDDDCDGEMDEDIVRSCSTICNSGEQLCVAGVWEECSARQPTLETCNGVDDDCDGAADEDIVRVCATVCGQGVETCLNGGFGGCTAVQPVAEICDRLDNDCDGTTDNLLAEALASNIQHCGVCYNDCRDDYLHGIAACESGTCVLAECETNFHNNPNTVDADCTIGPCLVEMENETSSDGSHCDSDDNDCDGATDEGCECSPDAERACGTTAQGACSLGTQYCRAHRWTVCEGATEPRPELCNSYDDDCDGVADEDNPEAGQECNTGLLGVCAVGVTACENGQLVCNQAQPAPIGTCSCDNGQQEPCGPVNPNGSFNTDGLCHPGYRVCTGGSWGECLSAVYPAADDSTCDGLDDDCDNETDEDVSIATDVNNCGACGRRCDIDNADAWCVLSWCNFACNYPWRDANQVLTDGCECVLRGTETCNGIDDDCDGTTDENNPGGGQICYTGLVGACAVGMTVCENGAIVCNPNADPVSGNCACNSGSHQECGAVDAQGNFLRRGICHTGTRTCTNGVWGDCLNAQGPWAIEVCDGDDNDCDGVTPNNEQDADNDGFQGCENDCNDSNQLINPDAVEVCDGLDNNCNGLIDNLIFSGQVINTGCDGAGACGAGVRQCDPANPTRTICTTEPGGQADQSQTDATCDGLDNDCDGVEDEGLECECVNNATRPCGTDEGECVAGRETCVDGRFNGSTCTATPPASEICDGDDNDCNGLTDENNPGGGGVCAVNGTQGVCMAGRLVCMAGQLVCTQTVQPESESCNLLDDDCDGGTDEDLRLVCSSACGVGTMACLNGVYDPSTCTAPTVPAEVCNGADDDCDGLYDEGDLCVVGSVCSGGICRPDADQDRVPDALDNCLNLANPNQADANTDGIGDACQPGNPLASGFCAGANILTGASFEDPALSGWSFEFVPVGAGETASGTQDTTQFVDGASSARITNSTVYPLAESWRVQLKQTLNLTVGSEYELCGWFRGDGSRDLVVQAVDDVFPYASAGLSWRQFPVGSSGFVFHCWRFTALAVSAGSSHRLTLMTGNSSVAVNTDRITLKSCP